MPPNLDRHLSKVGWLKPPQQQSSLMDTLLQVV